MNAIFPARRVRTAVLCLASIFTVALGRADPVTVNFTPHQDAFVKMGSATQYGTNVNLEVTANPSRVTYIQFWPTLPYTAAHLVSAKLQLYAPAGGADNSDPATIAGAVSVTVSDNNSWDEATISGTGTTPQLPSNACPATVGFHALTGRQIEADVTAYVNAALYANPNRAVTLVVTKTGTADSYTYAFSSKEDTLAGHIAPQLVLTFSDDYKLFNSTDFAAAKTRAAMTTDTRFAPEYTAQLNGASKYTDAQVASNAAIAGIYPWRTYSSSSTTAAPSNAAKIRFTLVLVGSTTPNQRDEITIDNAKLLEVGKGNYNATDFPNAGFETAPGAGFAWTPSAGSGTLTQVPGETPGTYALHLSNPSGNTITLSQDLRVDIGQQYIGYVDVSLPGLNPASTAAAIGGYLSYHISYIDGSGNEIAGTVDTPDTSDLPTAELEDKVWNRYTPTLRTSVFTTALDAANIYLLHKADPAGTMYNGRTALGYAAVAKQLLLYAAEDMVEGLNWIRPKQTDDTGMLSNGLDRDDTYEAVHIGRAIMGAAFVYDQIKDSGVISPDEDRQIRTKLAATASILANEDSLNSSHLYYPTAAPTSPVDQYTVNKRFNFNMDRSCGLGAYAITFPEDPRSLDTADAPGYISIAKGEINWVLDPANSVISTNGGWPETIRYHGSVMNHLIPFARMLQLFDGTNLFSTAAVQNMFRFLYRVQLPPDATNNNSLYRNVSGYPEIGQSTRFETTIRIPGMGAYFYSRTEQSDSNLSQYLQKTWARSGSYIDNINYPLMSFLFFDTTLPSTNPPSSTSDVDGDIDSYACGYSSSGLYNGVPSVKYANPGLWVMRNSSLYDQQNESFLVAKSSIFDDFRHHQDYDESTFLLFAFRTPLIIDSGTGGYKDGTPAYFQATTSHNVIAFNYTPQAGTPTWVNGPTYSSVSEWFQANASHPIDYITISVPNATTRIPDPSNPANTIKVTLADTAYTRHIAYLRGFEAYIVWDNVDSACTYPARFHLHTYATSSPMIDTVAKNITVPAYPPYDNSYQTSLQIKFLQPATFDSTTLTTDPETFTSDNYSTSSARVIKADAPTGSSFLAVLYPSIYPTGTTTKNDTLRFSTVSNVGGTCHAYHVTKSDGSSFYILVNVGGAASNASITSATSLTDIKSGTVYTPSGGAVVLTDVPPGSMVFLR